MSGKSSRAEEYLRHIFQAIERIERYTLNFTQESFLTNELIQDAVIRNLEVIGEASRNLERDCPEFVVQHPRLPLVSAYEMRNLLAHGYFRVDLAIVWKTVRNDLPGLEQQIVEILQSL